MAWVDLSTAFGYGTVLTSAQMQNLWDNITALANGDSGAPDIQTAALDDDVVTRAKLADYDSGVRQESESLVYLETIGFTHTSYAKVDEFPACSRNGTIQTRIGLRRGSVGTTVYGKVYKNGSPVGTERVCTSSSWEYHLEDIVVVIGDVLELWTYRSGGTNGESRFYLGIDNPLVITPDAW